VPDAKRFCRNPHDQSRKLVHRHHFA
jgi:hypothetical protein